MPPLLARDSSQLAPLAHVAPHHPCLWGEVRLLPSASLLEEHGARLLPTRRTGQADTWWTSRKQGAIDHRGQPLTELTDLRGERPIYALPPQQEERSTFGGKRRALVLYGGTIFEHFGHLLLDLNRLYRLLPLFRRSREPIWFHYPALGDGVEIQHPLVCNWLDCLGIRKRVRVVRRTLHCEQLVSTPVLYRDRCFVRADFPRCAQRALAPRLRRQLRAIQPQGAPIAYLSRHRLARGTTRFEGEQEVVEALGRLSNVQVICAEDLSIEAKLSLYRQHRVVTGFVQAAMLLKYFVPCRQPADLATQVLLVAGQHSLNSNWVNLEQAYGYGDQLLDCSVPEAPAEPAAEQGEFQREHRFNVGLVIDQLRMLAAR